MTVICLTGCSGGGFKTSTAIKAAKAYKIKEIQKEQYIKRNLAHDYYADDAEAISYYETPAYYYTKDGDEADSVYNIVNDSYISGLAEYFDCEYEKYGFILIIAKDEKTAKSLFDVYSEWFDYDEDILVNGDKNGCTYTLAYEPSTATYFGIYLKGKSFLIIGAKADSQPGIERMEYFCKKFGVISPTTVKK